MNKSKKRIMIILSFFIIINVCVLFIVCNKGDSMSYKQVRDLCNEIRNENTEEAIKMIEKSNNLNKTTYPPFLERFFLIVDCPLITTPLIVAVDKGNLEVVEVLLKNGANPNYFKGCGFTPIEKLYKVRNIQNHFEIAQLLIQYGADVNRTFDSWDYPIFTMADRISRSYDDSILIKHTKLFIENGAYVVNKNGFCIIDYFISSPYLKECIDCVLENTNYDINTIQPNGMTYLMYAVKREEVHAVKVLLEKGIDKTIKNVDGKTALDMANEIGNMEIINLLKNKSE